VTFESTEPDASRIPVCRICSGGVLVPDGDGWYCGSCGLRYKFTSMYMGGVNAASAMLAKSVEVLKSGFEVARKASRLAEAMSCEACRNARDPRHIAFGVECQKHREPPTG